MSHYNDYNLSPQEQCKNNIRQYYYIVLINNKIIDNPVLYDKLNITRRILHIMNKVLRLTYINSEIILFISRLINDMIYQSPWDDDIAIMNIINRLCQYLEIYIPNNQEVLLSITEFPLEKTIKDEIEALLNLNVIGYI